MPHIIDNKVYHDGQKLGWIDGHHVYNEEDGRKLGYWDSEFVYNMDGYKVAYIQENQLYYENGRDPSNLEHVNEVIEGDVPLIAKCAVKVLLDL